MRKLKSVKMSLLAFVLVALAAGCGREQTPSPAFPPVIATSPANGAPLPGAQRRLRRATAPPLRYLFGRSFNTGSVNSVARSFHASCISIPSGAASSDLKTSTPRLLVQCRFGIYWPLVHLMGRLLAR